MPSELRVDNINSTTSPYDPVFSTTGGALSHRNMIINGAMQVSQRGTSFAITQSNNGGVTLDRFKFEMNSNVGQLAGTVSQHSMSSAELNTTGFAKALKFETTTPETAWNNDEIAHIHQIIEAQNLQHLQYGTASAKSVTLSFWVKSSVTGTFAVGLYKQDSTSRIINKTITISDTNWNKYTLTFPGDTDSGATIANDNGPGIYVLWHLGAGSNFNDGANTSWENYSNAGWAGGHVQNGIATTNGATWYLTGVQLELGTVATPFEHRTFADDLSNCQRYYQRNTRGLAFAVYQNSTFQIIMSHPLNKPLRAAPTITHSATIYNVATVGTPDFTQYTISALSGGTFYQNNVMQEIAVNLSSPWSGNDDDVAFATYGGTLEFDSELG